MEQIKQLFLQVVGLVSSLRLLLTVFYRFPGFSGQWHCGDLYSFLWTLCIVDSYTVYCGQLHCVLLTVTLCIVDNYTVYCRQLHCVLWIVTLCIVDNYTVDRYVEGISLKLGVIILMLPLSLKGNARSFYNLHLPA